MNVLSRLLTQHIHATCICPPALQLDWSGGPEAEPLQTRLLVGPGGQAQGGVRDPADAPGRHVTGLEWLTGWPLGGERSRIGPRRSEQPRRVCEGGGGGGGGRRPVAMADGDPESTGGLDADPEPQQGVLGDGEEGEGCAEEDCELILEALELLQWS